jgi:hypothetical protein
MELVNIPFLPNNKLIELSNQFLSEHKVNYIPIDIENIIEFNYRMNIIPTPNLRNLTD